VSTVETDVLVSYILFPHVRDGLFPSLSLVGVADGGCCTDRGDVLNTTVSVFLISLMMPS
jgi:hypothetical protein